MEFLIDAVDGFFIDYSFFKDPSREEMISFSLVGKYYGGVVNDIRSPSEQEQQELQMITNKKRISLLHSALFLKRSSVQVTRLAKSYGAIARPIPRPNNGNLIHAVQTDRTVEKLKEYRLLFPDIETLLRMRVRQGFVIEGIQYTEEAPVMDYRGGLMDTYTIRPEIKSVRLRFMLRPNVDIEYTIRVTKAVPTDISVKGSQSMLEGENEFNDSNKRATAPHELSSYKLRRGSYDYQYVQHSRHSSDHNTLAYSQLDQMSSQNHINIKIFSNASSIFQEKFRTYKKKYPNNTPPLVLPATVNSTLLIGTAGVSIPTTASEYATYTSLINFVQGIVADDKMAQQLHNAAISGLSTNLQLRSSVLAPLIQLKERISYSPLFEEVSLAVQLPSDAPPYMKYEQTGEILVQSLIQRRLGTSGNTVPNTATSGQNVSNTVSSNIPTPPPSTANDMRYQHALAMLRHLCEKGWATSRISDDFYIKFPPQQNSDVTMMMMMGGMDIETSTNGTGALIAVGDLPSSETIISVGGENGFTSSGFSLLRVVWHTYTIVELKLLFFNLNATARAQMVGNLKQMLRQIKNVTILHRPVLCSVLEKMPHVHDDEINNGKQSLHPHYTQYAWHKKWLWSITSEDNNSNIRNSIMSVLFAQRLREGFSLVSLDDSTVFLKELFIEKNEPILTENSSPGNSSSGSDATKMFLFYCIHLIRKWNQIRTEVWLEPQTGRVTFDNFYINEEDLRNEVFDWLTSIDTEIMSIFKTFDIIYHACKSNQSTSVPTMLKMEEQGPDVETIPFNIIGIYEHSYKQPVTFNAYTARKNQEEVQKLTVQNANKKMFDRLVRIIAVLNDVEVPLDQVPGEVFGELGLNDPNSKYRCFVRIVTNGESSSSNRSIMRRRIVLTIISISFPMSNSINILVCECNENDLASLSSQSRSATDDPVTQFIFGDHNAMVRSSSRGSNNTLTSVESGDVLPSVGCTSTRMSPDSYHYFDFLLNMHSYSYAYGVYKNLQNKEYVSRQSVVMAVESCYEYREEIDLTEFFEAILLSRDYFFKIVDKRSKSPYEEMNEYFNHVIHKYFENIPGSDYHYYFNDFLNERQQTQGTLPPRPNRGAGSTPPALSVNVAPNSTSVGPVRKLSSGVAKLSSATTPTINQKNLQNEGSKLKPVLGEYFEVIDSCETFDEEVEEQSEDEQNDATEENREEAPHNIESSVIEFNDSELGSFSESNNIPPRGGEHFDNLSDHFSVSSNSSLSGNDPQQAHALSQLDSTSIPVFMRMECVVTHSNNNANTLSNIRNNAQIVHNWLAFGDANVDAEATVQTFIDSQMQQSGANEPTTTSTFPINLIPMEEVITSLKTNKPLSVLLRHKSIPRKKKTLKKADNQSLKRSGSGHFEKSELVSDDEDEDEDNYSDIHTVDENDEDADVYTKVRTEMDSTNWLNSVSSMKAALRIYCITLPPDRYMLALEEFEPQKKDMLRYLYKHHDNNQFSFARSKYEFDINSTVSTNSDEENSDDDMRTPPVGSVEDEEPQPNMGNRRNSLAGSRGYPLSTSSSIMSAPFLSSKYLPRQIRRTISKMKRRIQALISKEILNALLHTSPITPYVVGKIFTHVTHLPPNCYQQYTVPAVFVSEAEPNTPTTSGHLIGDDREAAVQLFYEELVKYKPLVFERVGTSKHYVVYFQKDMNNIDREYYAFQYTNQQPTTQQTVQVEQPIQTQLSPDEFHTSTTSFECEEEELLEIESDFVEDGTAVDYFTKEKLEMPYWIIINVKGEEQTMPPFSFPNTFPPPQQCKSDSIYRKQISVMLYSPYPITNEKRQSITYQIEQSLLVVVKRVNTLILLNRLHDTRLCSPLMIPPDKESGKATKKKHAESNEENVPEGAFACPLVHSMRFLLHRRLSTEHAMGILASSVFHPFVVSNRSNVYVYRERNGHVFYLRLCDGKTGTEKSDAITPSGTPTDTVKTLMNMNNLTGANEDVLSSTSSATEGKNRFSLSFSTMGNYLYANMDIPSRKSSLILGVYGVNKPSHEITRQLQHLVESKLSSMTLNVISSLLLRNRQFKLNVEDVEFIRPFTKKPDRAVFIEIPSFVSRPFLFLLLLRQGLLGYLHRLYLSNSSDPSNAQTEEHSMTEDEEESFGASSGRNSSGFVFKSLESSLSLITFFCGSISSICCLSS